MKKYLLSTIACSLLLVSCGKDEKTPYDKNISGVNLTDIVAFPAGTLGVPDSKPEAGDLKMAIYPTPCSNTMMVHIQSKSSTSHEMTIDLVNVSYKDAPKTWTMPDGAVKNVQQENKGNAGKVALTVTQVLNSNSDLHFNFDTGNLPQGFYRVYIHSDDGLAVWDNGWVLR